MSIPKRRTYLKGDERRRQILGVAKDVFARRGYRDANVADICEAASIGRGTLYQYFDNKRDVLRAVIEDVCGRVTAVMARRTPLTAMPGLERAPLEMIVSFCSRRVRELLDAVFQDEDTLRLILRDARGLDGAVDEILARIDAIMLGAIEADTRISQAAGLIRAELDPRLTAQFVLGGIEKLALAALATDAPIDLDAIARTAVQVQLFGVLAPSVRAQEVSRMSSRSYKQWPPYQMMEVTIEERARAKLDKLERLYHIGQDNAWDGREVLGALIAKHGPPRLPADRREPALKMLSILMWGELAAWAISADLAERIVDIEAKMAATSQAHDEARHFYVLRDYLRATGETVPRLGGIARRLLTNILETDNLVHKLVGMQLLVESNALGIFKGMGEAKVEPVLTELLPYYERDEARHVGLGVMYLPRLLRHLSDAEVAGVMAFQMRCMALLMTGGNLLRDDMTALGLDERKTSMYTMKLQADIVRDMLEGGGSRLDGSAGATASPASPASPEARGRTGRRRDAIRGLMNPGRGSFGPKMLDFIHPPEGLANAPAWHQATLSAWTRAGKFVDKLWA